MPSTAELLLLWDQKRPRTQQLELGPSDLGGCRRRAGYKVRRTPHVNQRGSVQAALGVAAHDAIADIMADLAAQRETPNGDLWNHRVEWGGVSGELDRYEAATKTVVDTKTTTERNLEHIKIHGAEIGHIWQATWYAAGCVKQGHPVEHIRIEYLCRDTGEEYAVTKPLDPQDLRDAVEWLKMVRDADLETLPRDYDPDSTFCRGCPFGGINGGICWEGHVPNRDLRSVLYAEHPDAAYWAEQLFDARYSDDTKARKKRESDAKGALSAIVDPDGIPTRCGDRWLRFTSNGHLRFTSGPKDPEEEPA